MPQFQLHPYDPAQAELLRPLIARHERVGFSGPSSQANKWYGGFAPEIVHFLKSTQGEVLASAGILHDALGGGLWCGGKQLSGTSVTSLVVEPAARGRGVATALAQEIVRDAASRNVALCTLYPASLELYRKAGFELAGDYAVYALNPALIQPAGPSNTVTVRPGGSQDQDAMVALRNRLLAARGATGAYDREALSWKMLFETTSEDPAEVLIFSRGGDMVGYLILDMLVRGDQPGQRAFWVQDWMAEDFEVRCALVKVIASFGTVHKRVTWQPQAGEDLADAMKPEPTYFKPDIVEPIAVRVIDPNRALAGRGYRPAVSGTLRLAIDDPLLDRKFDLALSVEGGAASVGPVKKPGLPRLAMSINALAPLLFGYRSASTLARMGWLDGPQQAFDLADVLFATEPSVTGDFY